MFAKIALSYLVVSCAAFVWASRRLADAAREPNPQFEDANRIAPKTMALMFAMLALLVAAFWPAAIVIKVMMRIVGKLADKEIRGDDDDDDHGMPQGA